MAIAPLNVAPTTPAANAFDFSPLAKLGQQYAQPDTTLASLGQQPPQGAFPAGGAAPVPYATASGAGGQNVQSWYEFAVRPVDQGGLGLTQAQAAGAVGNLQAESGANIPSWGPTGDAGSAHGAAQWRLDRLANLQKYAADNGLDYRSTEAQQGFMRQEYLGSERSAYDRLTSAKTPEEAAGVVNKYYERSADRSGRREANAASIARRFGLLTGNQ
jgi:Phage tail lysozyme